MQKYSKKTKRQLRELAELAYRREMEPVLEKLEAQFAKWRKGEIDCWELRNSIHLFHNNDARELYKRYEMNSEASWAVEYAVKYKILKEEELSAEVMEAIGMNKWEKS